MKYTRFVKIFTVVAAFVSFASFTVTPISAQDAVGCENPRNAVQAENCQTGSNEWMVEDPSPALVGYAFPPSVDVGDSLHLYVKADMPRIGIQLFRMGYYGGEGGREVLTLEDQEVPSQPTCNQALYDTGLTSCGNWTSTDIPIPSDWVSGVYVARFVRADGAENSTVFVVRDDEKPSDILLQQSNFTFQAYSNYGGKSLYNYNSGWDAGYCNTVTLAPRAAKVSLMRPYEGGGLNNFFTAEYPLVRWLEQQGYDVTYATNWDVSQWGEQGAENRLLNHRVFISAGHDEYWTQGIDDAVTSARDAGVNLAFLSGNTSYWRVRLEDDPWTGIPNSVIVTYKTSEAGVPDPSGHATTTFRDPAVNDPENSLIGTQYVGDNEDFFFPLRIGSEFVGDRIYRHTDLSTMPSESYIDVGQDVNGWEWHAVVDNGHTPEGLQVLAESPVIGFVLQDAGNSKLGSVAPNTVSVTRYAAPSGAEVFSTGTILWAWGLGARGTDVIPPDPYIQQITYNVLADLGVTPANPSADIIVDGSEGVLSMPPKRFLSIDAQSQPVIQSFSIDLPSGVMENGITAVVRWETDVPTQGQVWRGAEANTTNVGAFDHDGFSLAHSVRLDGLIPGTTYFYRVVAVDEKGQFALSDAQTFTTPSNLIHTIGSPLLRNWRSFDCWRKDNPTAVPVIGGVVAVGLVLGVGLVIRRRSRRNLQHV